MRPRGCKSTPNRGPLVLSRVYLHNTTTQHEWWPSPDKRWWHDLTWHDMTWLVPAAHRRAKKGQGLETSSRVFIIFAHSCTSSGKKTSCVLAGDLCTAPHRLWTDRPSSITYRFLCTATSLEISPPPKSSKGSSTPRPIAIPPPK